MRPNGRNGKRFRKKFATKYEAMQFEKWILATHHSKEWLSKPTDRRDLSSLIDLWWKFHGQLMKSGHSNLLKLQRINRGMGFPSVNHINAKTVSEYRINRIGQGVKPNTMNRELEALSGMFAALIDAGHFKEKNPIREISRLKTYEHEMGYLTKEQCKQLISKLSDNEQLAVRLFLSTGARWSEVIKLSKHHIKCDRVTFINAKNGKNRTVPISEYLFNILHQSTKEFLFSDINYFLIRDAIHSVAPELPKGQAVHALRHTFASHFMMNGGNILTLQKILGHSNIQQTMKYAHLSPDYLFEAVKFSPLADEEKNQEQ
ncbi:tyrosine-type recombinase/integrase [Arsenophonus sp. aPb]|uniref:phage integrase n=1 Tax=Arsenophonus sp. aPb TaxID=3041619 RepID=UPI002469B78A|nr:tyrosine-type recombinase/integrase [Arsenophonus sp. aPb]WGL99644.1 tyrosine-type recombinase/integrase [Arsenophonus sp. aPb]